MSISSPRCIFGPVRKMKKIEICRWITVLRRQPDYPTSKEKMIEELRCSDLSKSLWLALLCEEFDRKSFSVLDELLARSPKEYDDIQVMAEDVNFNKYVLLSQDIAISISPQEPPEERNWLMTICYAGEVIRSGVIQKCLSEDDVQLTAQESSILIIDTQ